mmetsp:Transcript_17232/g.27930  ORF Transcript_17232/g.27930 Transcript_17232/m.27930 type:complete len:337 (-) Transcript_17232:14-1024(-)
METALPRRVMETAYVVGDNVKTIRLAKIEEAEIPRDTRGVVARIAASNGEGSILFEGLNRWTKFTKSQMDELLVKDEQADRAWLNEGSRGHPHYHFCVSTSGCKFIAKEGRGCKAEECQRCHFNLRRTVPFQSRALPLCVMETAFAEGDNVKTIRLAKIEEAEIPRDTRGVVARIAASNGEGSILFEGLNRWTKFTKSQMDELLVKDEQADRAWLNEGSRGHPHYHFCVSTSGCKFIAKEGRGCKAEDCKRCHLCCYKPRNQEQRCFQSRRSHKKTRGNSEPVYVPFSSDSSSEMACPPPALPSTWAHSEPDDDDDDDDDWGLWTECRNIDKMTIG